MTESTLQTTIVTIFKEFYPELIIESSLNGIPLNGMTAKQRTLIITQLKAECMLVGTTDLKVFLFNGKTLHIELKRPSINVGKGQSTQQKEYQTRVEAIGHKYYLVNSLESFFDVINSHLDKEYRLGLYEAQKGNFDDILLKTQFGI